MIPFLTIPHSRLRSASAQPATLRTLQSLGGLSVDVSQSPKMTRAQFLRRHSPSRREVWTACLMAGAAYTFIVVSLTVAIMRHFAR